MVFGIALGFLSMIIWLVVGLIIIGYALYHLMGGDNDSQENNRDQPQEGQSVPRENDGNV